MATAHRRLKEDSLRGNANSSTMAMGNSQRLSPRLERKSQNSDIQEETDVGAASIPAADGVAIVGGLVHSAGRGMLYRLRKAP
jgi:hypothetical protein